MRLPIRKFTSVPMRGIVGVAIASLLSGCAMFATDPASDYSVSRPAALPSVQANNPQSDFPVTVGEPYAIAGKTFTPVQTLNYDEVGYLTLDPGAAGVTGSHHTLPVPSYAEVTSLENGKTILVRFERRGPMNSTHLAALSPAALRQLGASNGNAIRVRRVNPPESQRVLLRNGQNAPQRIDTPMSLVNVLRRKLPDQPLLANGNSSASTPAVPIRTTPTRATPTTGHELPSLSTLPPLGSPRAVGRSGRASTPVRAAPTPRPEVAPPAPRQATMRGGFVVQAGAFSSEANANRIASRIGGAVTKVGTVYRVRTGPFASRSEAEGSLARVKSAGYSSARIFTNR